MIHTLSSQLTVAIHFLADGTSAIYCDFAFSNSLLPVISMREVWYKESGFDHGSRTGKLKEWGGATEQKQRGEGEAELK